jgi:hypothetical protein
VEAVLTPPVEAVPEPVTTWPEVIEPTGPAPFEPSPSGSQPPERIAYVRPPEPAPAPAAEPAATAELAPVVEPEPFAFEPEPSFEPAPSFNAAPAEPFAFQPAPVEPFTFEPAPDEPFTFEPTAVEPEPVAFEPVTIDHEPVESGAAPVGEEPAAAPHYEPTTVAGTPGIDILPKRTSLRSALHRKPQAAPVRRARQARRGPGGEPPAAARRRRPRAVRRHGARGRAGRRALRPGP